MKKFFFNCQAKGGTGKSMLTYLQGLKNENNPDTGFIDLDSSTKTSSRQLDFLFKEDQPERLFTVDIFDTSNKIEREKLVTVLSAFNKKTFSNIYIDFGAPESEQLPSLLHIDYTSEELIDFSAELDAKLIFNILLCGGISYVSTFEYLKKMTAILNGKFDIVVYANMYTFKGEYEYLLDQVNNYVKKSNNAIRKVVRFGNIEADRESGRTIMELISQGAGWEGYKNHWMAKTKMKRLLAEI